MFLVVPTSHFGTPGSGAMGNVCQIPPMGDVCQIHDCWEELVTLDLKWQCSRAEDEHSYIIISFASKKMFLMLASGKPWNTGFSDSGRRALLIQSWEVTWGALLRGVISLKVTNRITALLSAQSPSCFTVILFAMHLLLTFFFFMKSTRHDVSFRIQSIDSSSDSPRNTRAAAAWPCVIWPHHALRLTIKLSHHRSPCSLVSFWLLFFTQAPHAPLTPLPVALLLLISLVPSGSDHAHPLPKSFSHSCLGISPMSPLL